MYRNILYPKSISWTLLNDNMFIFDEITNNTYLLKGLSRDFWLLIEENNIFQDIVKMLSEKRDIEYSVMENDIVQLTKKLVKNNLIIWS